MNVQSTCVDRDMDQYFCPPCVCEKANDTGKKACELIMAPTKSIALINTETTTPTDWTRLSRK